MMWVFTSFMIATIFTFANPLNVIEKNKTSFENFSFENEPIWFMPIWKYSFFHNTKPSSKYLIMNIYNTQSILFK